MREAGGKKDVTVVPLAKREIPWGTLQNIPRLAELTAAEFRELLR